MIFRAAVIFQNALVTTYLWCLKYILPIPFALSLSKRSLYKHGTLRQAQGERKEIYGIPR
jgi:hypothetical protein